MNSEAARDGEAGQESRFLPEWLRPNQVRDCYGIGRSKLGEMVKAGLVRSVSLRRPNQRCGTRLVDRRSLERCLERLADEEMERTGPKPEVEEFSGLATPEPREGAESGKSNMPGRLERPERSDP